MDFSIVCLFLLALYSKGITSFQATQEVIPQLPVFGTNNQFTLRCSFNLGNGESLVTLVLKRKRSQDAAFSDILTFPPPTVIGASVGYTDPSLEARTMITIPDSSSSTVASVTFNDTECSDIGEYKWAIQYYYNGEYNNPERISVVKVKVEGSFSWQPDFGVTVSTGYDVTEGTNVTFRCKANVGNEPQGDLQWFYYMSNPGQAYPISDLAEKGDPVPYETCSYSQESTLVLTMTEARNGIMLRCTLQQDFLTPDGDHKNQTDPFNVSFSPRQTTISRNPVKSVYVEGDALLTLTCSAKANPQATYTWLLPDGSESIGNTYRLQDLQINHTGNYSCFAKNNVPNENFTDSDTVEVTVVEKPPSTTPTTPSATTGSPKTTTNPGASEQGEPGSDSTVIIIVVCVVGGVLIIVIIVVIVLCRRKKQQEIEEPPEKPRNNQDLNFAGYRPGLTTSTDSLKNSGNNLNTSFNSYDSGDSKQPTNDGLMYVDLQFDDKPRSRRPIQVYDNGSATQYADIAMPRV